MIGLAGEDNYGWNMLHHYPPEYWYTYAQETRKLAKLMTLASDKRTLLKMAEDYDRLAMAAEEKLRKQKHQHPAKRGGHTDEGVITRCAHS